MNKDLSSRLNQLKSTGGLRQIKTTHTNGYTISVEQDNHTLINLSGNDYLGLASNKELQQRFFEEALIKQENQYNWMSSSSSRPLTGSHHALQELETHLAKDYQKESALVFNSGYHANTGILPAITRKGDLILADKLVHASIIDGLRLADADFKRFSHNSIQHLRLLLEKFRSHYNNVWIVSESVFSMDGDVAPIVELITIKEEFNTLLYIDEAHGVGCYGNHGLGVCELTNTTAKIDILVGTFGKALAGYGGFVVCDDIFVQSMVNFSRSWLFSTSLPPINIQWNNYIWQQLKQFKQQRLDLKTLTTSLRVELKNNHFKPLGNSHIVPLLYPENMRVIKLADAFKNKGILVMPIRSPTVKAGTERLRFSLTANLPASCIATITDTLLTHES